LQARTTGMLQSVSLSAFLRARIGSGMVEELDVAYRPGRPPAQGGHPAPQHRLEQVDGMLVERDLAVPMRDGVSIYADVYRPGSGQAPVIVAWSPYGKHAPVTYDFFPGSGVRPEWVSRHAGFEAPDPAYWVPRGYAVVNVDPRGLWYSPGIARFLGPPEAQDAYDLIEWVAAQPWSTGRVGMSGVSYLAMIQWHVASLRPPHLAAINPWEGVTDPYREMVFHGGIPETRFLPMWQGRRVPYSTTKVEDLVENARRHPLFDAYWVAKVPKLEQIEVPALVVASWSDQGLHTRGTLEGFARIASAQKWLWVHGGKKWERYYRPESVELLRRFFDRFLRGEANGFESEPRVRLEVRETRERWQDWAGDTWPSLQPLALHLDAASRRLTLEPGPPGQAEYEAGAGGIAFEHRFTRTADLVGPMRLRLWVEARGADDMDVFVAVRKLDPSGAVVPFHFFNAFEDGPVALGWLRASHRDIDPVRSTELRPWHPHDCERRLHPGEPVPVDIEIWPSATRFAPGDLLRLEVQGHDHQRYGEGLVAMAHQQTRNRGLHVLHTGGDRDSYLVLPVVS
jgi:predicted acyl esterase